MEPLLFSTGLFSVPLPKLQFIGQNRLSYHALLPWQRVAQVRVVAFQTLSVTFLTPFIWVVAVAAVLL